MIKGLIYKERIAVLYMYASNNKTSKVYETKVTERWIKKYRPIIEDLTTPFSVIDITSRKQVRKDIDVNKYQINQLETYT